MTATTTGWLKLVTPPTLGVCGLAELKDRLRLGSGCSDGDAELQRCCDEASDYAEVFMGRQLLTATYDLFLPAFPGIGGAIVLPRPPLQSVTSVTYTDANGDSQTLATSAYTVDANSEPGCIVEAYGTVWPSTRAVPNAVTVRYVCGYTKPGDVPERVRSAVKIAAGELYYHDHTMTFGVSERLNQLLWSHRVAFHS